MKEYENKMNISKEMRFMGESQSCSLALLNKLHLQTKKKKKSTPLLSSLLQNSVGFYTHTWGPAYIKSNEEHEHRITGIIDFYS